MGDDKKLLTAAELGEVLRLKPRTVLAYRRRGIIPGAIRIGKRWLWRHEDLDRITWAVSERGS
jgi:predicted site-specific integrase-resolvase